MRKVKSSLRPSASMSAAVLTLITCCTHQHTPPTDHPTDDLRGKGASRAPVPPPLLLGNVQKRRRGRRRGKSLPPSPPPFFLFFTEQLFVRSRLFFLSFFLFLSSCYVYKDSVVVVSPSGIECVTSCVPPAVVLCSALSVSVCVCVCVILRNI